VSQTSEVETGVRIEAPERFRPKEYGGQYQQPVRLGDLCMLSQARSQANPALPSIEASIASAGLLNEPIIARLNHNSFKEYVEFVNHIWGSDERFDDFSVSNDGYFYLVIAGHTRISAVNNIEVANEKAAAKEGFTVDSNDAVVWCKVYDAPDPDTIISIQLDENLHEKVPEERSALAIVEAYYFGLKLGKWTDEAEFSKAVEGKFTPKQLNKALAFARLPSEFRDIIFAEGLPYVMGILAEEAASEYMSFVLKKYHENKTLEELDPETREEVQTDKMLWLGREISYMMQMGKRMNQTAYRKKMENYISDWHRSSQQLDAENDEEATLFELEMIDPLTEWRSQQMRTLNEYMSALREFERVTSTSAAVAISSHARVLNKTGHSMEASEVLGLAQERIEGFAENLGNIMIVNAAENLKTLGLF
jgi:hypothetical protein